MPPLRDNTLEILLTRQAVQVGATPDNPIEMQEAASDCRHDRSQSPFTLQQRQAGQILAIDRQHVEGIEVRSRAVEQQIVEPCAPVRTETADLPIEYRQTCTARRPRSRPPVAATT